MLVVALMRLVAGGRRGDVVVFCFQLRSSNLLCEDQHNRFGGRSEETGWSQDQFRAPGPTLVSRER